MMKEAFIVHVYDADARIHTVRLTQPHYHKSRTQHYVFRYVDEERSRILHLIGHMASNDSEFRWKHAAMLSQHIRRSGAQTLRAVGRLSERH